MLLSWNGGVSGTQRQTKHISVTYGEETAYSPQTSN